MHVIAKDQYGNEVDTQHALEGVDYYCSLCGATVRIRRCVVRTDHFFLFKDKHKSKDCAEIENEKNVVRDPALLNVSKFVRKTILVSSRSDRSNARESTKAPQSSKEVLPPKSLCQLMACGVCQMPADTPIEGGVLSDLLITYRSFSQLLSKNESLGMQQHVNALNVVADCTIGLPPFRDGRPVNNILHSGHTLLTVIKKAVLPPLI